LTGAERRLVAVTGATGAVGPAVVHALGAAGFRVRLLELAAPEKGLLPDGVEVVLGDITDAGSVQAAVQGAGSVVHLAALLHADQPRPELRHEYERVNVGGTANVVEASARSCVERVVLFSTISVYGPTPHSVATEDTPPRPGTVYAETKLAAERLVLAAKGPRGEQIGTVLRLGAAYGPRLKGNYLRLVRALAHRRFVPIGRGTNRRTLVFDRDAARAAVLAVQHPAAAGQIFNVSDAEVHTVAGIVAAICAALGRRPPRFHVPVVPARFLATVVERAAPWVGIRPPLTRAAIEKYVEDVAVDSHRIRQELGFASAFDLSTGWWTTIQEMRSAGLL
jgi:nucleoside-diphosphate-sugar epimerase